MCGIAGIYNLPAVESAFPAMLERIASRGPDAAGVRKVSGGGYTAILGHRRLTIIDLSDAANQPFTKDGLCLVFNGEIYNYRELRSELMDVGVLFRTKSDTEVILEAWRAWGSKSLSRLRGMFAFALLEESTGQLILARDPFGIKPMHFAKRGRGLAFASEIKALVTGMGPFELDPQGLVASLVFGWLPDAFCIWKDIVKLPGGHYATFDPSGRLSVDRFYDLRAEAIAAQQCTVSDSDLADIVDDSVRAHMVSDVPVSTFLSGGLDSSLISALAQKLVGNLESYTIAFRPEDMKFEAMPDDLKYARIMAQRYGIKLHEIEIAPDIVSMLPRIVDALDEPIGDSAAINTILICDMARKAGAKVLLSGMGADEMFGGYRKHQAVLMAERYRRLPAFLRKGVLAPLVDLAPVSLFGRGLRPVRFAKRFMSFADLPEEAAFRRSYSFLDAANAKKVLHPDLMPYVETLFDYHAGIYDSAPYDEPVNRMCFTDIQLFMEALNLTYTDRSSMSSSTEVRVPFIDVKVMKAALSIPGRRKIVGNKLKLPLKNAALRTLPREIVFRPKALFSTPLRAWIRGPLREMVDERLAGGRLVSEGWISAKWARMMIDQDRAGIADYCRELWQLLTIETWLSQNCGGAQSVDTQRTTMRMAV